MSDFKPNFTQTPNVIFDELMADLTGGELRCLLYICRRTYGFHRDSDSISYSQFEHGIKDKEGNQVDMGCGLSRETISISLQALEDRKIIVKKKHGQSFKYSINLEFDYPTSTSLVIRPEVVGKPDIQKKEKEREIKIHSSAEYLVNIPPQDLIEFSSKYSCTPRGAMDEGETAYNWIKSKGKTYKDYKSMLQNWLKRTFGYRVEKKIVESSKL